MTKYSAVLLRREGATELRYAMRFVREYPRTGGIGVTLDSIDPHAGEGKEVTDVLEAICEVVGYSGIIQAELYRDAGGQLHVIDVNPRLWGSVWFAERLGTRVLERSIRAALGLPALPPPRYDAGYRFHTLSGSSAGSETTPSPYPRPSASSVSFGRPTGSNGSTSPIPGRPCATRQGAGRHWR